MDDSEKKKITEALTQANATLPCPRCGNNQFSLIEGYHNIIISKEMSGNLVIGGPVIPTVMAACNRCGFVSHHALGALGLLPPTETKK